MISQGNQQNDTEQRNPDNFLLNLQQSIEGVPPQFIVGAILILSILALIPIWINFDIISPDSVRRYLPVAQLFLEGRFHDALYGPHQPIFPLPLYEFSVFLMAKTTGFDLELSGRLVSSLSFVLGSFGIYKVTELIFKNRSMALLSVIFFISNKARSKAFFSTAAFTQSNNFFRESVAIPS